MKRNRGPWSLGPGSPSATTRVSEGALWSSVRLSAGLALAGETFHFFTVPLGQGGQDITDTNIKEARRLPNGLAFTVRHVSWTVVPLEGETEMEKLANAFGVSGVNAIKAHGVLTWDLTQTWIDIAPLWTDWISQNISIPDGINFSVMLRFGKDAPTLTLPHVIRLTVVGEYAHPIEIG